MRSERSSLLHIGLFSNGAMNRAFAAGLAMQLAVLLIPPLQRIFSTVPMTLPQWGAVLALAVAPVVVCEAVKAGARAAARPARREKHPAPVGAGAGNGANRPG